MKKKKKKRAEWKEALGKEREQSEGSGSVD